MNYLTKKKNIYQINFYQGYYINKSNDFLHYISINYFKNFKKILIKKKSKLNLLHNKVNYNDLNNLD